MTSANCECLPKCSLASLGRSVEMKGHVCPSICLFVYLFVCRRSCFFRSGAENMAVNRVGAGHPAGIFFNQGSDFIYISSSLNHSVAV